MVRIFVYIVLIILPGLVYQASNQVCNVAEAERDAAQAQVKYLECRRDHYMDYTTFITGAGTPNKVIAQAMHAYGLDSQVWLAGTLYFADIQGRDCAVSLPRAEHMHCLEADIKGVRR